MPPSRLSLSVLVPVYNEERLVAASLSRLRTLADCELICHVEVVVVDDGSVDATAKVLADFQRAQAGQAALLHGKNAVSWIFLHHDRNRGKGSAIRTGLIKATGDVTVIHDADLEYDPQDIVRLIRVFVEKDADAVFGSRFAGTEVRRVLLFWHQLGNNLLTFLCNMASNLNLTDVWSCYKAVRTSLLKSIPLSSNDFRIEPELTIKLAKRRARIFEVPISYYGRGYEEGKKIGWKDGLIAIWAIIRFALRD